MIGITIDLSILLDTTTTENYDWIQQQQSHLSQVFGVGYMNQKRIMPD